MSIKAGEKNSMLTPKFLFPYTSSILCTYQPKLPLFLSKASPPSFLIYFSNFLLILLLLHYLHIFLVTDIPSNWSIVQERNIFISPNPLQQHILSTFQNLERHFYISYLLFISKSTEDWLLLFSQCHKDKLIT